MLRISHENYDTYICAQTLENMVLTHYEPIKKKCVICVLLNISKYHGNGYKIRDLCMRFVSMDWLKYSS